MTIRRAVASDAEHLTTLIHDSSAYRGGYASIISGYRVTADYIARHRVFVAVDAVGRLLGLYALVVEPPELDLAFVADSAQGTGIGRLLIEHMIDQARQVGLTDVRVVFPPPGRGVLPASGRRAGGDDHPIASEGRMGTPGTAVHHRLTRRCRPETAATR